MLYCSIYTDWARQYCTSKRLERDHYAVVKKQLQTSCQSQLKYSVMNYLTLLCSPRDVKKSRRTFFKSTTKMNRKSLKIIYNRLSKPKDYRPRPLNEFSHTLPRSLTLQIAYKHRTCWNWAIVWAFFYEFQRTSFLSVFVPVCEIVWIIIFPEIKPDTTTVYRQNRYNSEGRLNNVKNAFKSNTKIFVFILKICRS